MGPFHQEEKKPDCPVVPGGVGGAEMICLTTFLWGSSQNTV